MLVVDNNCTKQLVYNPRIDIHRLKTLVRNICLLFVECKEKQREKKNWISQTCTFTKSGRLRRDVNSRKFLVCNSS